MAYYVYMNGMLLPVTPEAIQIKINGKNEKVTLMDQGEVNILKTQGLTDVLFDALLPNVKYPFAMYQGGFRRADYYLSELEKLKKIPFQLVISREFPGGIGLFGTSMKVSLEDYTIKEDAGKYGTDVMVSLKMKQYKEYGTKTCKISGNTARLISGREQSGAPSGTTHTVQEGESLWEISKRNYGDGKQYKKLQKANGIRNPNNVPFGKQLLIPR